MAIRSFQPWFQVCSLSALEDLLSQGNKNLNEFFGFTFNSCATLFTLDIYSKLKPIRQTLCDCWTHGHCDCCYLWHHLDSNHERPCRWRHLQVLTTSTRLSCTTDNSGFLVGTFLEKNQFNGCFCGLNQWFHLRFFKTTRRSLC